MVKKISEWAESYDDNLRDGQFTCFFCKKTQNQKEMLSFARIIEEKEILGCTSCLKLGGERASGIKHS